MLKFYYSGAPNPTKVALFLEESGLPYQAIPVDTREAISTNQSISRSIRMPKCPPSLMAARLC